MSRNRMQLGAELKETLLLAGPIVLTQAGQMVMGVVDTIVAGHINTTALAGLGLAANYFWTITTILMGCLLALDTYFSQAVGARDEAGLQRYLGQSLWTSAVLTVVSVVGILIGYWVYGGVTAAGPLREVFLVYLRTVTWSTPSLIFFFVLQRYWQSRGRVMPFVMMIIGANFLNLAACLALGLGKWGFPRLEAQGLALATVISRTAMLLAALVLTFRELEPGKFRWPRWDWAVQKQIFRLGWPAAGHTALEIGSFGIATFVVSALGAVPLAAHHLCIVFATFSFMFPLGFSSAAAVRVGTFIGAGEPRRARRAGWLCIGTSVTVMGCFALSYLFGARQLLGLFTQDQTVIAQGAKILLVVAFFQLADGTQISTIGALRGLGNTHSAMIANLLGHYPIGLPLGLALCFHFKCGVVGLWIGLATALCLVAVYVQRVWWRAGRDRSCWRPIREKK